MGECRGPRPPLFFPRTVDFPAVGTEADASAVFAGDAPDFAVAVQYGLVDTVFNESAFLVDSCDSAQCLQRLARSLERAVFNCSAINPDDSSGFLFVPGRHNLSLHIQTIDHRARFQKAKHSGRDSPPFAEIPQIVCPFPWNVPQKMETG